MSATTDSAATVTNSSAILYGNVTSLENNDEVTAGFRYGQHPDYMTFKAESTVSATGSYNAELTNLSPNSTYYFQAYAATATDTAWAAVMNGAASSTSNPSGVQGICPDVWHVPSDAEWKQMEMEVGMSQSDADNTGRRGNIAAKLSGNTGWILWDDPNAAGNFYAPDRNSSGFSALPAGTYTNSYSSFSGGAYFWSATQHDIINAYGRSRWDGPLQHHYGLRLLRALRARLKKHQTDTPSTIAQVCLFTLMFGAPASAQRLWRRRTQLTAAGGRNFF